MTFRVDPIKAYNSLSEPAKASYWFLICGVIQRGLSFITTPIFTRLMSSAEYGLYNVYISWHNIFAIFITLNLAAGVYLRGLVKYEEDRSSFSQSMYLLTAILAAGWCIVFVAFRRSITELTELPFLYLVLIIVDAFACSFFQFWSAEQRVDYRYKKLVILTLASALTQTAVGIAAVRLSKDKVMARALVVVCSDVAFYAWLGVIPFLRKPMHIQTAYWRYGIRFNIPLIPHYLSQVVLNQSDRIMIKKYTDPSYAGLYSLAYSLASVSTIVNTAIINTLTPWMYKKIQNQEFEAIRRQSLLILSCVAAVNLLLILVAPELILLLGPEEYYPAVYVVPPVTASVFFIFLYSWFSVFEFYFEKTYLMTIASVAGAAANIVLNYVFIRRYGYLAAGYTTLFCYVLYVIGHYFFMRRICKKELSGLRVYDMKAILLLCAVFVLACAAVMLLYEHVFVRYAIVVCFCAAGLLFRKRIVEIYRRLRANS